MTPEDLPQYAKETGVPLERLGTPRDIAGSSFPLLRSIIMDDWRSNHSKRGSLANWLRLI